MGMHSGERRRERDEVVAVICSGRAREREVRWRQSFAVGAWAEGEMGGREERGMAVDGAEKRGCMKQNNYQPVR